jgi:hypothetical protein
MGADWQDPEAGLEDDEGLETCAACGASVAPGPERGFAFGSGNVLCWQCATARGGRYDEARESWDRAPDLSGLPDEAYGASPHEIERRRR